VVSRSNNASGAAPIACPSAIPSRGSPASTAAVDRAPARPASVRLRKRMRPTRSRRTASSRSASATPRSSATCQAAATRSSSASKPGWCASKPSAALAPSRARAAASVSTRDTGPATSAAATAHATAGWAPTRSSAMSTSSAAASTEAARESSRARRRCHHFRWAVNAISAAAVAGNGPPMTAPSAAPSSAEPTADTLRGKATVISACSDTVCSRARAGSAGLTTSAAANTNSTTVTVAPRVRPAVRRACLPPRRGHPSGSRHRARRPSQNSTG